MNVDEAIRRLTELREVVGGDADVCIESERTTSGLVRVFVPACFQVSNVVDATTDKHHKHWVCLMNGNNTQIVSVF